MTSTVDSRPIFSRALARAAVLEERRGGAEHRRRLLAGLRGRVIELGAGSGVSFAYYPATVTELVAVEPEEHLRAMAQEAAAGAPVPVRVVEGVADRLPARGRVDGRRRGHRRPVQRARPGRRRCASWRA